MTIHPNRAGDTDRDGPRNPVLLRLVSSQSVPQPSVRALVTCLGGRQAALTAYFVDVLHLMERGYSPDEASDLALGGRPVLRLVHDAGSSTVT
jgi:hypothetical protein